MIGSHAITFITNEDALTEARSAGMIDQKIQVIVRRSRFMLRKTQLSRDDLNRGLLHIFPFTFPAMRPST